jgi:archaemetzincin
MGTVQLVPLPGNGDRDLQRLAAVLQAIFLCPVVVAPPWREIDFAFDAGRGQYSSRAILGALLQRRTDASERVIGVTGLDLFVPVLTFVFGEAQLNGRAAVVSTCRLATDFYGLPPDELRLQGRLEKEAVHELGHTFGLLHCPDDQCVMRSSTYAEELDMKAGQFCDDCRAQVEACR